MPVSHVSGYTFAVASAFPPVDSDYKPRQRRFVCFSTPTKSILPSIMASSAHIAYSGKAAVLAKNDNDVVIVAAVRTAMTKVPFYFDSRFSFLQHSFYRGSEADLRILAQRSCSRAFFAPFTRRSTSTLRSLRTLMSETFSLLAAVRVGLAWLPSMPVFQSPLLLRLSTVNARPASPPSTRSLHRSPADRLTLASVRIDASFTHQPFVLT